jgi:hypothetical protein
MTDPNPYQTPADTVVTSQRAHVNWRLSGVMIMMLAPVAAHVALFIACSLAYAMHYAGSYPRTILVSLLVVPALAALVAMLLWGAQVLRREQGQRSGE